MDTSKIIKGVVSNGRYTVTAPIVKEDYGLYLKIEGVELPSTYEVDFSNSENNGTSVTMIGNADGVLIPHQFIDTGKDIFAFLYHVGANYGRTVYKFRIPNKVRPDRTEDTPTPEEQSVIDQAISALNEAVAQTAQDVIDADASAQSASADADRAEDAKTDAQNFATQAEQSATDAQISAQASANSATASAQSASQSAQIKADVEELADDAQGYAQASERSASASANSASQAQGYAQSASASAQSASGYASQAQTSAQTASTKASEASTSASTASQKASKASQSASQALTYKTDAESAKTASQTAQGLAESARDSAISAKTDAESARDDAVQAKEDAESAVASISGALDDKAPVITDTASGAIASFSDGADDLPLKSLVVDINPIQDLSHGDPSPENICPISGWTGCEVGASGKNLLDNTGINDYTTWEDLGSNRYEKALDFIKGGETYTVSGKATQALNGAYLYLQKYVDGAWVLECGLWQNNVNRMPYTFVASNAPYRIWAYNASASISIIDWIQIELGTTATAYEPYTGRTIPINWQTEAGTVYGGKLDVLSGVMRVTHSIATIDGNANISVYSGWRFNIPLTDYISPTPTVVSDIFCDKLKILSKNVMPQNYSISGSDNKAKRLMLAITSDITTVDGAKAWLNENPITVVYPLATPIEIQLTPQQVNSLLGVNNIFADTGDTEVEYRANTKLYIERLTAPDSADMIADSNIVSGQYFMVGNNLYKATANIANGGQITVGTNCTRVSLAQALNEINA